MTLKTRFRSSPELIQIVYIERRRQSSTYWSDVGIRIETGRSKNMNHIRIWSDNNKTSRQTTAFFRNRLITIVEPCLLIDIGYFL